MNFTQLVDLVNKSLSGTTLTLSAAQLGSGTWANLVKEFLPNASLTLSDVTKNDAADDSITIAASGAEAPFKNMSVKLVLDVFQGKVRGVLTASASADWSLATAFPELNGTVLDELAFEGSAELHLNSYDVSDTQKKGFNFTATVNAQKLLGGSAWLLHSPSTIQLGGAIIRQDDLTLPSLSVTVPKGVGIGKLELGATKFSINTSAVLAAGDRSAHVAVSMLFSSSLEFRKITIPLSADYESDASELTLKANVNSVMKTSLSSLSDFANGADLNRLVPGTLHLENLIKLSDLEFVIATDSATKLKSAHISASSARPWTLATIPHSNNRLKAESIVLTFDVTDPLGARHTAATVNADLDMAGAEFSIEGDYPGFKVNGSLSGNSSINLTQVFEYFLGGGLHGLPELEITSFAFTVDPDSGDFNISAELDGAWTVLEEVNLAIKPLNITIARQANAVNADVKSCLQIGDAQIEIEASYPSAAAGWTFSGGTAANSSIDLSSFVEALLQKLGISAPMSVPQIVLKSVNSSFNTQTKNFSFSGETQVAGQVPLANFVHSIDTSAELKSSKDPTTGERSLSGCLTGSMQIGPGEFDVTYALADKVSSVKASWKGAAGKSVDLNEMLQALGIAPDWTLPSGLDLSFKSVELDYDISSETLTLSAQSNSFGEAFLFASKVIGQQVYPDWQVMIGYALPAHWKLSDIPGAVGHLLKGFDFVEFESAGIVVSSFTSQNFSLKDIQGIDATQFAFLNGTGMPLVEGFNLGLDFDVRGSSRGQQQITHLAGMIGEESVVLAAEFDLVNKTAYLLAELSGGASIKGSNNNQVALNDVTLRLGVGIGLIMVELSGSVVLSFSNSNIDATGHVIISDTEANVTFEISDMQPTSSENGAPGLIPAGLPGIWLDEIGITMGALFEPPEVDLGLEGEFHVGQAAKGSDKFAFVVALDSEIPNPELLYVHFQEVSLETIIAACLNTNVPLSSVLKSISISDLLFYWAELDTLLPDNTMVYTGFGLAGTIQIVNFAAYGSLIIRESTGFTGTFEMDPITLPGVSIGGKGKGKQVKQVHQNGQWVTATNFPAKIGGTAPRTRTYQQIKAGGPIVEFSTVKAPYVNVSIDVEILKMVGADIDVTIGDDSFSFVLAFSAADIASMNLACTWHSVTDFSASASFAIGIKGSIDLPDVLGVHLGSLDLDISMDADLDITIAGLKSKIEVQGDFEFEGLSLSLPKVEIDIDDISKLGEAILKELEKDAASIFADLLKDAGAILAAAKQEAEKIGKDAEAAAKKLAADTEVAAKATVQAAKATAKEIASVGKAAVGKIDQAASDVAKAAEATVAGIENTAKEAVDAIDNTINQVGAEAAAEAEKIAKDAAKVVSDIEAATKQAVEAAAAEVEKLGKEAEQEAEDIVNDAKAVAKTVLGDAEKAVSAIEHETEKVLSDIKNLLAEAAEKAKEAAEKAANAVKHAGESAWHAVSKY